MKSKDVNWLWLLPALGVSMLIPACATEQPALREIHRQAYVKPSPRWLYRDEHRLLAPEQVVLNSLIFFGKLYRFGDEIQNPPHDVKVVMPYNAFSIVSDYRSKYVTDLRAVRDLTAIPIRRDHASSDISALHKGIDIYAPTGTPVLATSSGYVSNASFEEVAGETITLLHGSGMQTYYVHLDSTFVSAGDRVQRGQIIGTVGSTGNGSGGTPHLHLEVKHRNRIANPHLYWYNGRGLVTLFRPGEEYHISPHLFTYPIPGIEDIKYKTDWRHFGFRATVNHRLL